MQMAEDEYVASGTMWTASATIISSVMGPSILSMAYNISSLGWVGGPIAIISIALITAYTAFLQTDSSSPSSSPSPQNILPTDSSHHTASSSPSSYHTASSSPSSSSPPPQNVMHEVSSSPSHPPQNGLQIGSSSPPKNFRKLSRNYTFVVRSKFGPNSGGPQAWVCGIAQIIDLLLLIFDVISLAEISMVAIRRSNCFYKHGHDAYCEFSGAPFTIGFGVIQIIVSQMPDSSWMSIVGVIMCLSYSSIAIGLSITKVREDGKVHGTLGGSISEDGISSINKLQYMVVAIGDIAKLYTFSTILLEIQDTLRSPPSKKITMRKAIRIAVSTTTFFLMLTGFTCYAAFGFQTPKNPLNEFGFYDPYWLLDFSNACIVVQAIGLYQVFCQPIFAIVDDWTISSFPHIQIFKRRHKLCSIGENFNIRINCFHLIWKTGFVVLTIMLYLMSPLIIDILNLLGPLVLWVTTFYFPIIMHISDQKHWSAKWTMLQFFNLVSFLASCLFFVMGLFNSRFLNKDN